MNKPDRELRLSGGTLFILLTRAMKKHGRRSRDFNQRSDGISEANLLKDLVRIYYPNYPDLAVQTERSNATNFKKGADLGELFAIRNDLVREKFHAAIIGNYNSKLSLAEFVYDCATGRA